MFLSPFLNLLFPSRCPLCTLPSDLRHYNPLCAACWNRMERYTGPACTLCGLPTDSPRTGLCESCLRSVPPFSGLHYYGIYEGPLREAIHLLKFSGLKRLSGPLSSLLHDLPIPEVDGVVSVPLHRKKLKHREFNQSALLGRHLARHRKTRLLIDAIEKVRETPDQTEVTGKERFANIRGAFYASSKVRGLRLLLVDDVITTGATVHACAKALVKAGAQEIVVAALARSMPRR